MKTYAPKGLHGAQLRAILEELQATPAQVSKFLQVTERSVWRWLSDGSAPFPVLAALPDDGPVPGWTAWLVLLPPVVAFAAAAWSQWVWPTVYYVEGAVRGTAGGVVAGLAFGVLASLAGGAVGPGRMQDVAPYAFDALLHAVTSFGLGGLLGGLVITWWQRRTMPIEIELDQ